MPELDAFASTFGRSCDASGQSEQVRREGREYLEAPLIVYEEARPYNKGWVDNISEHGLGLVGVTTKVNDIKTFVVYAEGVSEIDPCKVQAVCRWVQPSGPETRFDAGFEIIRISVEDLHKLVALVPGLAVDDQPRGEKREPLDQPIPIYEAGNPLVRGQVLDISERGFRVSGISVNKGAIKTLALEIPGAFGTRTIIEVEAVCRWACVGEPEAELSAGFEVKQIFGHSFEKLTRIIPKPPARA